jgi:hypothetical protein
MKKSNTSKSNSPTSETVPHFDAKSPVKYYTGGAGPSRELAEYNTQVLGRELKLLNVLFKEDREFAEAMWGGDELSLRIVHPKKPGDVIYAAYDRWGFVLDNTRSDLDQETLEVTVKAIKDWYFD